MTDSEPRALGRWIRQGAWIDLHVEVPAMTWEELARHCRLEAQGYRVPERGEALV